MTDQPPLDAVQHPAHRYNEGTDVSPLWRVCAPNEGLPVLPWTLPIGPCPPAPSAPSAAPCSRPGHPGPYAHTHPYISSLCANGDCPGCVVVGELSNAPDFCDHDCHKASAVTASTAREVTS